MVSSHYSLLLRHCLALCLLTTLGLNAAEKALLVPVDTGIHRIQVEIWDTDTGEWVLYSVAHLDGTPGTVKVRIPDDLPDEFIRVSATARSLIPTDWIDDDSTLSSRRMFETDNTASRAAPDSALSAIDSTESNDDQVVESDIWKLSGDELYFFNQSRGLQVFDLSDPSAPFLTGSLRYPARGEQMYQLDGDHLLLIARAQQGTQVELVRLHDGAPYIVTTLGGMPGYYLESRLIGSRLYIATESGYHTIDETTGHDQWIRTVEINGFDLGKPGEPVALNKLTVPLGHGWGHVLTATNDTLILSTNQRVYAAEDGERWSRGWHYESTVHLIDLNAEGGHPYIRATAPLEGRTTDKFKLRLRGDTLTAITQAQGYRVITEEVEIPNPALEPRPIENPDGSITLLPPIPGDHPPTITITQTRRTWYRNSVLQNFVLQGDTLNEVGKIELAEDEDLRATRFDGDLAYIVTFEQIDPLFAVDLSNPAEPTILGELEVPGWSTYLQILEGGRLFSLGVESGRVALSLFDVTDPTAMRLSSRVYLGEEGQRSWAEGVYDEKAISVFPEAGLALIPYQAYQYSKDGYFYETALQLVELSGQTLTLRGTLDAGDRIRRASLIGEDTLISVSNDALLTASIVDRDTPAILADLTISWNTDSLFVVGEHLLQIERQETNYWGWGQPVKQNPTLRVSPANESDRLLLTFDLLPGTLAGLTVRAGTLYALYSDYTYEDGANGAYRLEVYDVSDPLAPTHTASTEIAFAFPNYYWMEAKLEPAWKDENTLVWMPTSQNFNYGWGPRALDGAFFGCCWLPYGISQAHLLVADVAASTGPRFTAGINLTRASEKGSAAYSPAFLSAGKIVLTESYHWWEPIEVEDPEDPGRLRYSYENHVENHLLSVALKNDGTLGQPHKVEILGTLTGVIPLEEGALLALTREREPLPRTEDTTGPQPQQTLLHAFLFDGSQVLPIDRLALGADNAYDDSQLTFAFSDRVIYRAGHDYAYALDRLSEISRIQFSESGEFDLLEALPTANVARHDLDVLNGHLLNRNEQATQVWTLLGPTATEIAQFAPPTAATWWGWSWNQTGDPTIVPGVGLWIPAGYYGVDYYPLPPSAGTRPSFLAHRSATAWNPIPRESLAVSALDAADTVGPMEELRWRFKARHFVTVDADARDFGDYWYASDWYGWYHQRGDSQWIFHLKHGWQWVTSAPAGTWVYDSQLGWCWTRETAYPYLYSAERGSWLFFLEGSATGAERWFFDFGAAEDGWFSVSQS